MTVHIEVPGDFGKGQLNAIEFWSENDLTPQPGGLLKHGRHVEHVILPKKPNSQSTFISNRNFYSVRCSRQTSLQAPAVCQNGRRSHKHGMSNRPGMPHKLLNTTPKVREQFEERGFIGLIDSYLPDEFRVCEPNKEHYLQLWPSPESSGQTGLCTPR